MVYHRYPKLGVVNDVTNHFILAFEAGRGPKPDVKRVSIAVIVADAGYDSESNHCYAREELSIRSIIR